jgi:hypothetical protein
MKLISSYFGVGWERGLLFQDLFHSKVMNRLRNAIVAPQVEREALALSAVEKGRSSRVGAEECHCHCLPYPVLLGY